MQAKEQMQQMRCEPLWVYNQQPISSHEPARTCILPLKSLWQPLPCWALQQEVHRPPAPPEGPPGAEQQRPPTRPGASAAPHAPIHHNSTQAAADAATGQNQYASANWSDGKRCIMPHTRPSALRNSVCLQHTRLTWLPSGA